MIKINKEINKTRFKVLLNNLLIESANTVKVLPFYRGGLVYEVYPIENTLLNKYLVKL